MTDSIPATAAGESCKGHKHSTTLGATVCPKCGRFIPDTEVTATAAAYRPEPKQTHLAAVWNGLWGPRCDNEARWVVPLIPKEYGRNLVDCQRCLDWWGHDDA